MNPDLTGDAFTWLAIMVCLGLLCGAVIACVEIARLVTAIRREGRAARARRWWL